MKRRVIIEHSKIRAKLMKGKGDGRKRRGRKINVHRMQGLVEEQR